MTEPDPAVAERSFSTVRKGFDPDEVRAFLASLAARLAERDTTIGSLTEGLAAAEARVATLESELGEAVARAEDMLAEASEARGRIEAEGRREAERLVAEAEGARTRVLRDLRRRRKKARIQVEQLQAARERLLAGLADVRRTADAAIADLRDALPEARLAADAAARRVAAEDDLTVEQLESEIEVLRLAGLSLSAPVPVVEPAEPVERRASEAVKIVRPVRPPEPLQPLEAPDPDEAVRLVTLEDLEAAEPETVDLGPGPSDGPAPVAAEPEPADVGAGGGPAPVAAGPETVDAGPGGGSAPVAAERESVDAGPGGGPGAAAGSGPSDGSQASAGLESVDVGAGGGSASVAAERESVDAGPGGGPGAAAGSGPSGSGPSDGSRASAGPESVGVGAGGGPEAAADAGPSGPEMPETVDAGAGAGSGSSGSGPGDGSGSVAQPESVDAGPGGGLGVAAGSGSVAERESVDAGVGGGLGAGADVGSSGLDEPEAVHLSPSDGTPVPVEPEPADGGPSAEPGPLAAESSAAVEPEAGEPDEPEPTERPATEAVDALFARLKANRAERVIAAEAVLDPGEPDPDPEPVTHEEEVAIHRGGGASRADLLARRDEAIAPAVAALARRVKRLLADDQNEVLDGLRRQGTGAALGDPAARHARWAAETAVDLAVAATAGVTYLNGRAVAGAEPTPGDLVAVAETFAEQFVGSLHRRLAQVLASDDDDADSAGDVIRAVYRTWRMERLGPAVQDAVLDAFAAGITARCDPGTPVCWVVDDGGVPCPDAEDNALAGGVGCGEAFPTGHARPPAHPGCRCVIVPLDATTAAR